MVFQLFQKISLEDFIRILLELFYQNKRDIRKTIAKPVEINIQRYNFLTSNFLKGEFEAIKNN